MPVAVESRRGLFRTRGMPAAMVMGAAAFGGWAVLLPVVPLIVSLSGGSDTLAGSVTAVFMAATVVTQLGVPRLLRRWGHRWVLAAGCMLLGPPSLLLLLSTEAIPVLAVSAVRGSGFGMLTVASSALVAELVPREMLGRATGAQGIAVAAAQMVGLPAGLAIMQHWSATPVFVIGALIPALAVVAITRLPAIHAPADRTSQGRIPLAVLLTPWLAIAVSAAAFGGLSSLLPIAISERASLAGVILAVSSGATLIGRYAAGSFSDRLGVGRALVPALTCVCLGLVLFAVAAATSAPVPLLVCAALAFGFGFGAVQNESLVMIFTAAGPARFGSASAGWNIGFDAGTGFGSLALGAVASAAGYSWVFAVAATAVAVVPAAGMVVGRALGRRAAAG
ncbi:MULTISPECIES: MFS transporter [Rhodococcus]|uniref:Major facilitator transporter n=1 Tax=Rhodococcus opacus RKJ300 = JCM 13270 TaxID=1165867 RepID=I0WT80_RHOOP|nr:MULTISPECIES: MFS transporter [Rhodococcus]EID79596.1 major facilitator transporter [Rhodococcus opacus RKJ300 = JCM 13270]QQZ16332.1 MFS transporter [Rhodococcus sp. 21391]